MGGPHQRILKTNDPLLDRSAPGPSQPQLGIPSTDGEGVISLLSLGTRGALVLMGWGLWRTDRTCSGTSWKPYFDRHQLRWRRNLTCHQGLATCQWLRDAGGY